MSSDEAGNNANNVNSNNTTVNNNGPDERDVPAAPYPPMMSSVRFPSAQFATVRASLTSSSPQYPVTGVPLGGSSSFAHRHSHGSAAAVGGGGGGGMMHGANFQNMSNNEMGMNNNVVVAGGDGSSGLRATNSGATLAADPSMGSAAATAAKGGEATARPYTCRVQFCHTNMVACINCQESDIVSGWESTAGGGFHGTGRNTMTPPSESYAAPTTAAAQPRVNRKLGPILLELRQLTTVPAQYRQQQGNTTTMIPSLFTTQRIALSRGNPSLGASVASTCLDVSSILPATSYNHNQHHNHNNQTRGTTHRPPPCATGLTTGALCIHTFSEKDGGDDIFSFTTSTEYFHTPRHHRPATAVSWRRHNSRHVAIGLVSSGAGGAAPTLAANMNMNMNMNMNLNVSMNVNARVRGAGQSGPAAAGARGAAGGGGGSGGGGGDRDFCCFLWDIEHQAMGSSATGSGPKRSTTQPLFKLSHNAGVASLAWLLEGGQTLAVGGQQRNIQLYDLRVSGTSSATPPISAFGHNFGVHGIEVDPFRAHQFATFSRAAGEPVKVWDARRMDSVVSEIKVSSMTGTSTTDSSVPAGSYVSSLRWSAREAGVLSVAMGDVVLDYDTSSRPVLSRVNRARGVILDMALYPGAFPSDSVAKLATASVPVTGGHLSAKQIHTSQREHARAARTIHDNELIAELYPQRMLVVLGNRTVQDMAKHTIAPLAVSRRDGRVVSALGKDLFLGSTRAGPSAMESSKIRPDDDISATMMRRARCLRSARYSMDTASNIQVLTEEMSLHRLSPERDALLRLWTWIDRIEALCTASNPDDVAGMDEGGIFWASKGFDERGVWKLLEMGNESHESMDEKMRSDSLSCDLYDSPVRRAALTACGWTGRFDLSIVLSECESLGEFERSAALAVFHGSLGSAVDALQRGADAIHRHMAGKASQDLPVTAPQYAETLQLVAMCVAGFGGVDSKSAAFPVWRRACESLMRRPDLTGDNLRASRTSYLRALCTFLINISIGRNYDEVLNDSCLSLCDRVAFACRFLPRDQLKVYLMKRVESCQQSGNIEGLVISGIEKQGIKIVQSYVDHTADVQTAALVTSRVILPNDWTPERRVCAEFLDSYRTLLNTWQMWQSRAMFDVDRADLLRRVKVRQADAQGGNMKSMAFQSRRMQSRGRQGARSQPDPDIVPSVPAQLDARCTYCSTSLGLKRLDAQANQWLSKMKPVLSCCPSCQKPLPRCAICLLSLGCLNPYMELTRERDRARPPRGGTSLQAPDDLSSLANLPFAEWFTWCMTCKHGGHAHHLVGWFANHEVCPVSGCNCRCQFDGIQKLQRPALTKAAQASPDVGGIIE